MSSNFQTWFDDADMPTFTDGRWVDLETGLPFDGTVDYSRSPVRNKVSASTRCARDTAKLFGGKALVGSAKQVAWAETIRVKKLAGLSEAHIRLVCDPDGVLRFAKLWIDNRDRSSAEFVSFVTKQKALLAAYNEADCETVRSQIAKLYNDLTAKWGVR